MPGSNFSFVPELLKYGGLGVLALLCLVVLGQNAWNLNSLVKTANPKRIAAARPLLLAQMAISIFGLLAVGAGAIFLERLRIEDQRVRTATVILEPWDSDLDQRFRPVVLSGRRPLTSPFEVNCEPGGRTHIAVNFRRYVDHAVSTGFKAWNEIDAPRLTDG
jgi:predicted membrane metal-binding protein